MHHLPIRRVGGATSLMRHPNQPIALRHAQCPSAARTHSALYTVHAHKRPLARTHTKHHGRQHNGMPKCTHVSAIQINIESIRGSGTHVRVRICTGEHIRRSAPERINAFRSAVLSCSWSHFSLELSSTSAGGFRFLVCASD